MLNLAEYIALSNDLYNVGETTEAKTLDKLEPDTTKLQGKQIAKSLAQDYQDQYEDILDRGITEASVNAVNYYNNKLNLNLPDSELAELTKLIATSQYSEEYFGLTLAQRLFINQKRLMRRIDQSSTQGNEKLAAVYTKTVPFGAQIPLDKRVLLSTMTKVEQDTVRHFAEKTEHKLVRWNLSHRHSTPDVCDDLANNTDDNVIDYLEAHHLNVDPKGLYFVNDLPLPPHPNCQCEYGLITDKKVEVKPGRIKRTVDKLKNLLKKVRGK